MFQTAPGVKIPYPEKIKEEYQVFDNYLRFNISFEKIKPILNCFLESLAEPLFLVLELPATEQEENELWNKESYPFHKKICYLDGQSKDQIKELLNEYGELLISDGMSQFAIASHTTKDEIYIRKYKIIDIYSKEVASYFELLERFEIKKTDNLETAWDTFSMESFGETTLVELDGKFSYDVFDELSEKGMYIAKFV